ncbi:hypothetical protein JCM17380_17040 [Desulfosporosinus burensis]
MNTIKTLTVTVTEAAKIIGISRGLAYTLVNNGTIPSLKLGSRVLIPIMRLEEFINKSA